MPTNREDETLVATSELSLHCTCDGLRDPLVFRDRFSTSTRRVQSIYDELTQADRLLALFFA